MKFISLTETGKFILFQKIRPHIRRYLLKSGVQTVPYKFYGGLFWASILASLGVFGWFLWPIIVNYNPFMQFFASFGAIVGITAVSVVLFSSILYFYYDFMIFTRTKAMEDVLADFLRYVVENLKGGLSFEKALWESIRPRFGVLAMEVRLVAKRVMTGEDLDHALEEFSNKYDSPMLRRSFNLVVEGIRGGSQVADIIERVEANIRATQELKREISVTNTTYVMFITLIICVVSPGLFGLGYTVLHVMGNLATKIGPALAAGVSGASLFADLEINPESLVVFSRCALVTVSIFSSMIISMIKNGNVKEGIPYIPVFIGVSLGSYEFFKWAIFNTLGTMVSI